MAMSVLKRRSRIVSFRLLEDEYRALESLCVSEGVRSISDLARSAVWRMLQRGNGPVDQTLEEELGKLKGRMEGLDSELRRLGDLVEDVSMSEAPRKGNSADGMRPSRHSEMEPRL
jgi:hypothetical protein